MSGSDAFERTYCYDYELNSSEIGENQSRHKTQVPWWIQIADSVLVIDGLNQVLNAEEGEQTAA